MRQKHKRALYGYSTKSVERATETLQLSYQKSRQALESELDGILQQAHLESVKQSRINGFQEPISLAGKKAK